MAGEGINEKRHRHMSYVVLWQQNKKSTYIACALARLEHQKYTEQLDLARIERSYMPMPPNATHATSRHQHPTTQPHPYPPIATISRRL